MINKTRSHRSWQLDKLCDPGVAARYLNVSLKDSPEMFLKAVGKVAQARQMSKVAKEAGVKRESLYRALSTEGNPTWDTLHSVLAALGLRVEVISKDASAELVDRSAPSKPLQNQFKPPKSSNRRGITRTFFSEIPSSKARKKA